MAKPITLREHSFPKQRDTSPHTIVLRDFGTDVKMRYVTAAYNDTFGGYGNGHYFASLEEAEADFEARVSSWNKQ